MEHIVENVEDGFIMPRCRVDDYKDLRRVVIVCSFVVYDLSVMYTSAAGQGPDGPANYWRLLLIFHR